MLIRDKKHFSIGILMAGAFFGLFLVIMSPVFGGGMNGLEFSDDIFNKLSKGSSNFFDKTIKVNETFMGKKFSTLIRYDRGKEEADKAAKLLSAAGATVAQNGSELKVEGDTGRVLSFVIQDAKSMYDNDGTRVKDKYGYDERKVLKDWWTILGKVDKALQLTKDFSNAKMFSEVSKKLVEPSYNFYGIQAQKVTDKLAVMAGLLSFYVIYTMWWGFALYNLFEGLGLTTKKPKVKKEL